MPNRIVREGINSSRRVNALTAPEEVFYRRLMSIVDDYGRFEGDPALIRARCFPLRTDDISTEQIAKWATACWKAGLLTVYKTNRGVYVELRDFGQQTRTKSKFPSSSEGEAALDDIKCYQMIANAHLVVSVSVGVVVSDSPPTNGVGGGLFGAEPPRAKSTEKKPRTEAQDSTVIAIWMDVYEHERHVKYKLHGRDKGAAKQLGEMFPMHERPLLRKVFRAFIRDPDTLLAKNGITLFKIMDRIQKYVELVSSEIARQQEQEDNDDDSTEAFDAALAAAKGLAKTGAAPSQR